MDCRETRTLLTAFHDGELPDAERARVENHLRGCPECGKILGGLARADEAARVPDPGSAYWERFNARLSDRIGGEAEGPKAAVLRPKTGRLRQQLRLIVPAAAAAALVVAIVQYGGRTPVAPIPSYPVPAVAEKEPAEAISPSPRRAVSGKAGPSSVQREKNRMAERSRTEEKKTAPPEPAPAAVEAPSPASLADRGAPAASSTPVAAKAKAESSVLVGESARAASPCEAARALAAEGRWKEAESAQRECLAGDPSPATQEKGLVFLAELLDQQARFAEADAVLAEAHRQFPESRPLDLYRQQQPMIRNRQAPVPAAR